MQIPLYCSVFALALSALPSSAHPVHPFSPRSPQSLARAQAPADANVGRTGKPVRGVNLGGWLILENWENPSMFLTQQLAQQDVPDEWTWMSAVGNDITAKAKLKKHWDEWITEEDFKQIKSYGLNTVRLPVPYWAFNTSDAEPYQGVAQRPYIRAALDWARIHELDVMLDLHAVPGSQNGYDNSGHAGAVGFAHSPQNAARAIDSLVKMVEWYINDPKWGGVVKAIELANEPRTGDGLIPMDKLRTFYRDAYKAVRGAVNSSAIVRPTVILSDAFKDLSSWDDFYADNRTFVNGSYALDTHQYQAWAPYTSYSFDEHVEAACNLSTSLERTNAKRPVIVGEFSLGIETRCVPYKPCAGRSIADDVATLNSDEQNLFARRFWEAQTSTFEKHAAGWIFWNWKTESAAAWSYKDAVAQGWIPENPDTRVFAPQGDENKNGTCVSEKPSKDIKFATRASNSSSESS